MVGPNDVERPAKQLMADANRKKKALLDGAGERTGDQHPRQTAARRQPTLTR
ncbi:hypothetical protein [Nocardioides terrisoli]|uniref:hypothetical protein n=1 Tax=Nocardioides terrisoli TaxID=3388267 RepID=UPI00287B888A|nr:hypothetical protein [Nocardioides marmorisolisilvae]